MKLNRIYAFFISLVMIFEISGIHVNAAGENYINLDFSNSTAVTGLGDKWSYSEPKIIENTDGNGLAELSSKSDSINYYQYKLSSLQNKISGKFVIELKIKQSSASAFYLKTFMNDGSMSAADLTARFTDDYVGATWVDNTATSNTIGYFNPDVYPENPDIQNGWQKLYLCIDSDNGAYTIYVGDREHSYTKTGAFTGKTDNYLNSIRFGMSAYGSKGTQVYSYIDYIKIYSYTQLSLPSANERTTDIKESFDSNSNGTIVTGLVGKTTGSATVETTDDSIINGNKCVKIAGNTSGGYASIPIGYKNGIVKYRFHIESTTSGAVEFNSLMFKNKNKIYSETTGTSVMGLHNLSGVEDVSLNDGWNTAEWVINTSNGITHIACHVNGAYILGENMVETALSSLRIATYTDTVYYFDDIEIYGTDANTGRIKFGISDEENFNYSDGTSLSEHSISGVGTDNGQTYITENNLLKLSNTEKGESYITYSNSFAKTADDYTVEFRIQNGKTQTQFIRFNGENGKCAEMRFSNGFIKDTFADKNIGTYFENIISDGVSNEYGFHTYYITFSPSSKSVFMRIDDARDPIYLTAADNCMYADSVTFGIENAENAENTLYIDNIKMYNDYKLMPGASNASLNYTENFDGEINFNIGDNQIVKNRNNNGVLKLNGKFNINTGNTYRKHITAEFTATDKVSDNNITVNLIGLNSGIVYSCNMLSDTEEHLYSLRADILSNTVSMYIDGNEIEADKAFTVADSFISGIEIVSSSAELDNIKIMENGEYSTTEKQKQLEAGYELWKKLSQTTSGDIDIPKGGYRFANNYEGSEGKFYLYNKNNLKINGNGSEIIMDGYDLHAIYMNNSENVNIENLKIDYDPIPFSQGTITSMDKKSKTFDLEIDDGYVMPQSSWGNMRSVYYTADGKNVKAVTANDSAYVQSVLSDNSVRLKLNSGDVFYGGAEVGDKFVCRNFSSESKSSVNISNSKQCNVENVEIYTSPKLAITESGGYGKHTYKNVKITRRPGTDRLVSSIADGFHLSNVQNGCSLDNCEVAYTLDDCLNSYGLFSNVSEKISDNEYIIAVRNADNPLRIGQNIDFYNPSWDCTGNAKIANVTKVTESTSLEKMTQLPLALQEATGINIGTSYSYSGIYKVTLDKSLPQADYMDYAITEYANGGTGLSITNSYFHDSHVRGLLVKASDVYIHNNIFENICKSAIAVVPERYFGEGGFSKNLEISDNKIKTAGYSRSTKNIRNYPSIFISASDNAYLVGTSDNTNFKNITIKDNIIEDSGYIPMYIANTDGGNISGNTVIGAFGGIPQDNDGIESGFAKPWYGIKIEKSKNIDIYGNEFKDMPDFLMKNIYNPDYFEQNFSTEDNSMTDLEIADSTAEWKYTDEVLPKQKYFTITPKASKGSIFKYQNIEADKPFVTSFSVITESGTSYIMYDSSWNAVIDICFGNDKTLYINGNNAGTYSELKNINVSVIGDGKSKYEIWLDRSLKYTVQATKDISIIGIYFSSQLKLKNFVTYTLEDGFDVENHNDELILNNRTGQTVENVDIISANFDNGLLNSTGVYHNNINAKQNIGNASNTDKVFIWRNMLPICGAVNINK